MTQRNEHIELAMEELERYGLRGEVSERGKHLEIAWNSPQGRRFVIVPKTPSDWRSGLNTRSDLRKLLRADNLQPKVISELSFQKAMSLPKPQTISREQIFNKDVEALTDMVFELQHQLSEVQSLMQSMKVESKIVFEPKMVPYSQKTEEEIIDSIEKYVPKVQDGPFRENSMQGKIYACLTKQYQSVHEIAKLSGVPLKYTANTLSKAKLLGFAENELYGQWRRK